MKIKRGDKVKIPAHRKLHPEEGHLGTCVWISENRETMAVRCDRSHQGKKNVVFLVRLGSES